MQETVWQIMQGLMRDEVIKRLDSENRELRKRLSFNQGRTSRAPLLGACVNKKQYQSHAHALADAAAIMRNNEGVRMEVYKCESCRYFHVGGRSK